MRRIPRAEDKVQLEREILRQPSLVTHSHDVYAPSFLMSSAL
jgi:hypothetical protein